MGLFFEKPPTRPPVLARVLSFRTYLGTVNEMILLCLHFWQGQRSATILAICVMCASLLPLPLAAAAGYFTRHQQWSNGTFGKQLGFGWYRSTHDQKATAPLGFLPITRKEAIAGGWRAKNNVTDEYVRSDMPSYRLVFSSAVDTNNKEQDHNLVTLIVQVNAPLHEQTLEPLRAPGTTIVRDCSRKGAHGCWWTEYHVHFRDDGNVTVGDLDIPPTWKTAEEEGWMEVGCIETMGGAHYVAPFDLMTEETMLQRFAFAPIYNKYTPGGGGLLTALQLVGGTNATVDEDIVDLSDVDNYGENIVKVKDVCASNMCGVSACMRTPVKGEFILAAHLFLTGDIGVDLDSGYVDQIQCQGGRHFLCHESTCAACCGEGVTPGEEFLYDATLSRDSPFRVSGEPVHAGKLGQHCYPDPAPPSEGSAMSFCVGTFASLRFDILDYDRYHSFFRDDSTLTLAEAGVYKGASAIREYVSFADEKSAFKSKSDSLVQQLFYKDSDLEEGVCMFTAYRVARFESETSSAREAIFLAGAMFEFTYDFKENYVSTVNVFYTKDYIDFVFNQVYNSDQTRDFVCAVSEEHCTETNVGMSRSECKDRLARLPIFSNGTISGNDYGCRVLHSFMASINHDHCAHISFEPQKDPFGKIKCQEPYDLSPLDLFSQQDIDAFLEFLDSRQSLIEDSKGFEILYMPKEASTTRLTILGGVIPLSILVFAYIAFRKKDYENKIPTNSPEQVPGPENLLKKRNRQLTSVLILIPALLVFFNGLASIVLWFVRGRHPEWHEHDDGYRRGVDLHPMVDAYFGESLRIGESDPQEQLSDDQFKVYVGFVLFVTCLIAGIGLEMFVWSHFLQVWNDSRESLWRFVQFIFPLMLATALGLALRGNFLCLPVLVAGLYKFGFPETIMYLYLGLYSPEPMRLKVKDLMFGVGVVIHHSAANMIVCMILAGVIPPSRYVLNCTLPLVMQHWVVLLSYCDFGLFAGIELVLEYYFEWIIFSNFAEIYNLHWVAALGASVMVFSHWLFLGGGLLEILGSREEADTLPSGEAVHSNLHVRGNRVMSRAMSEEQRTEEAMRGSMRDSVFSNRRASSRAPSCVLAANTLFNIRASEASFFAADDFGSESPVLCDAEASKLLHLES